MRKLKLVILLFAGITLYAQQAAAQACLGLPSFANRPAHVTVGLEFPDSASSFAVGLGAGRHNNLFANLGGGQITFEGEASKANLGFLELGYQLAISKAQICPIAGGYFSTGPDDEEIGLKVTTRGAVGGLAAGVPFTVSMLTLVPNAAVRYEYTSQKVDETEIGSANFTSNATTLDLGIGIVVRDFIAVQPLVHVPLSGDGDKSWFGVYASVAFGWKR